METLLQNLVQTFDMRSYQPQNLRAGLKGGVFFGLIKGTVLPVPVGEVVCTAIDKDHFGAKGKINEIKPLGIKGLPFDGLLSVIGHTEISAKITQPVQFEDNFPALPREDSLTYYLSYHQYNATVYQTKAEQTWFQGAYTDFWVEHNVSGFPPFNIRFWWERT